MDISLVRSDYCQNDRKLFGRIVTQEDPTFWHINVTLTMLRRAGLLADCPRTRLLTWLNYPREILGCSPFRYCWDCPKYDQCFGYGRAPYHGIQTR